MKIQKLIFAFVIAGAMSMAWAATHDSDSSTTHGARSADASATTQPSMSSEHGGQQKHGDQQKLRLEAAMKLIDKDVRNDQGQKLGSLENIVVNVAEGRVQYGVLSFGGFLGIGDKYFAIPWSAMKVHQQQGSDDSSLRLNVSKQQLEKAPGFNKDNWPDFANPQWASNVDKFWREQAKVPGPGSVSGTSGSSGASGSASAGSERDSGAGASARIGDLSVSAGAGVDTNAKDSAQHSGSAQAGTTGKVDPSIKQIRRLEGDLIGKDVKNQQAKDLGDLKDVMINLPTGQVVYGIIQFSEDSGLQAEGGKDIEDVRYPVPWQALNLMRDTADRSGDALSLAISTDRLKGAPHFTEDNWPNMNEMTWNNRTFEAYNMKPQWQQAQAGIGREDVTG